MIIGRVATFLSFVLGIILVPLLDMYESIFVAVNDVIAHIAPPITCVFVLGVFWGKASGTQRQIYNVVWIGVRSFVIYLENALCMATGNLRVDSIIFL